MTKLLPTIGLDEMAETVAATANSSSSSGSRNTTSFHQLNFTGMTLLQDFHESTYSKSFLLCPVLKATVDASCIPKKPSPYVEILVDGKVVRKTESLKNTHEPTWTNETFTVYVKLHVKSHS